jgi:hypothetical protein
MDNIIAHFLLRVSWLCLAIVAPSRKQTNVRCSETMRLWQDSSDMVTAIFLLDRILPSVTQRKLIIDDGQVSLRFHHVVGIGTIFVHVPRSAFDTIMMMMFHRAPNQAMLFSSLTYHILLTLSFINYYPFILLLNVLESCFGRLFTRPTSTKLLNKILSMYLSTYVMRLIFTPGGRREKHHATHILDASQPSVNPNLNFEFKLNFYFV